MQSPQELTLDRYLRKRSPLEPPQAVKIAMEVASQLSLTADSMLVHPGRILVTRDGTVRLLPPAAEELALPPIVEFPAYASPEEIRGSKPDLRSGLYSLGCTLFELLAGQPPFTSADPREVLHAHLEKPVPDLKEAAPGVSDRLAGTVMDLLAKDPELRIQTPDELVRRLRQSLASPTGGSSHPAAVSPGRATSPHPPASSPPPAAPPPRPAAAPPRPTAPAPPPRAAAPAPAASISASGPRPAAPRRAAPAAPQMARGEAKPLPAAPSRAGRGVPGRRNASGSAAARRGADARGAGSRASLRSPRERGIEDLEADLNDEDAEDLGPEPPRRRNFAFTIGGGVIGILIGLLVVRARDTDVRERKIEIEKRLADDSKEVHAKRKQSFTVDYDRKRRDVELSLASIDKMPAEEKQDAYFRGMQAHWMSPTGYRFGEALAKVWVPPTAKASQETPEAARAYEAQLQEAKKLHAEGKLAEARDKIITDVHLHKKHQQEIEEYQKKWEAEYVAKWEVDKTQVERLARDGKPDDAVKVLRDARLYGDEQIRKEIDKMETSIQSQVVLQGGTKESAAKGDDENLEKEFEKGAGDAGEKDTDKKGTDKKGTDKKGKDKEDEPPEDKSAGEPEDDGAGKTSEGDGA